MKVTPTRLPEVLLIEPRVFDDARGFFLESWNQRVGNEALGVDLHFVQDNHSRSRHGVLRGLHYQLTHPQGKLVRCVTGRIFDVVVDLRRSSPRLGHWMGMELSADNKRQLWIPPGFGHGSLVLSDEADFLYKTTDYYMPSDERALAWNDAHVGITWPLDQLRASPILSDKDASARAWVDADLYD